MIKKFYLLTVCFFTMINCAYADTILIDHNPAVNNGGMESGDPFAADWTCLGQGAGLTDPTVVRSGNQGLRVNLDGNTPGSWTRCRQQFPTVSTDDVYYGSAFVKPGERWKDGTEAFAMIEFVQGVDFVIQQCHTPIKVTDALADWTLVEIGPISYDFNNPSCTNLTGNSNAQASNVRLTLSLDNHAADGPGLPGVLAHFDDVTFKRIEDSPEMILYLPLDTPPDEHNRVYDPRNNFAATVQGAEYSPNGRVGGTYYFDGIVDAIVADQSLGYQANGSIAFWMKADEITNWRNVLSTDYGSWDDNIRFEVNETGTFHVGALGLGTIVPFPNGVYEEIYTEDAQADQWYHVVYAWDDTHDYGYLNGVLVFSTPHPDNNASVHPNIPNTVEYWKNRTLNLQRIALGNGYSARSYDNRFWKGYVDEVRIYNYALTSAEVIDLYDTTAQKSAVDLTELYYEIDAQVKSGELNNNIARRLKKSLDQAHIELDNNNIPEAIYHIDRFIKKVNRIYKRGKLELYQKNTLLELAEDIKGNLSLL